MINDQGIEAYVEARRRERDVVLPDGTAHWRRVALIVAKMTGKEIGLDTATRMAMDADFSGREKLTLCFPSAQALWTGGKRERAVFG